MTRVYPSVAGGQVRADAQVPGLDNALIGRRVTARLQSGSKRALLVPQAFVSTRFGIDYVTLRSEDGSTTQLPVQTAPSAEAVFAATADRVARALRETGVAPRETPLSQAGQLN